MRADLAPRQGACRVSEARISAGEDRTFSPPTEHGRHPDASCPGDTDTTSARARSAADRLEASLGKVMVHVGLLRFPHSLPR